MATTGGLTTAETIKALIGSISEGGELPAGSILVFGGGVAAGRTVAAGKLIAVARSMGQAPSGSDEPPVSFGPAAALAVSTREARFGEDLALSARAIVAFSPSLCGRSPLLDRFGFDLWAEGNPDGVAELGKRFHAFVAWGGSSPGVAVVDFNPADRFEVELEALEIDAVVGSSGGAKKARRL